MHNFNLPSKINDLDLLQFKNKIILLNNYKYQIIFDNMLNNTLKIQLLENNQPKIVLLCSVQKDKIINTLLSGSVASILRKKGLKNNEMVVEAWDIVRQVALLCHEVQ